MGSAICEPVVMLVFGKTEPKEGGRICREEEATFCRADSGGDEAGRGWGSSGGADREGRDQRADFLLLEEAVCRDGTGSGATDDYSLIFLKLRLWVRGLENILSPFSTRVAI
jgi:hypothetical protein